MSATLMNGVADSLLNVPVDVICGVSAEQAKLKVTMDNNHQDYLDLKQKMGSLLAVATNRSLPVANPIITTNSSLPAASSSIVLSPSSCSSTSTFVKTVKSVESIQAIDDSSDSSVQAEIPPPSEAVSISNLEQFLDVAATGKLDLSDELLKEMYNVNTRLDAVIKTAIDLQQKWSEIDTTISQLKIDIDNVNQYLKVEDALLHNFPLPPKGLNSLQYSIYIANLINRLLPQLPIKIKWEYISTAHYLPTRNKKSNVIIVRFSNRNIKDLILSFKHFLPRHMAITEHLTQSNLSVFKKAQELFGRDLVSTKDCKIFVNVSNALKRVTTLCEVHKLYVQYCELVDSDQSRISIPTASVFNHRHAADPVRSKFFNPSYAAVLEKFNPSQPNASNYFNKRHSSGRSRNSHRGRSFYKSGK